LSGEQDSLVERLVDAGDDAAISALVTKHKSHGFLTCWPLWRKPRQAPPAGDWRVWLMLAGRGFGKTRAGAEWVRSLAEANGGIRIALVGATLDETRALMVEGECGLLNISPAATRPRYEPSRRQLTWRSGAVAKLYSGENPEGLRGPGHHFAGGAGAEGRVSQRGAGDRRHRRRGRGRGPSCR